MPESEPSPPLTYWNQKFPRIISAKRPHADVLPYNANRLIEDAISAATSKVTTADIISLQKKGDLSDRNHQPQFSKNSLSSQKI